MREITELMAGTAEGGEDLSAGMVEGVNLLVAAVHHVHEFLFLVSRETNPPCRTAWVRQSLGSCPDPDVPLEVSHLVEHLYPIALPVAHVYQSGVAHRDAMDDLRKHSGITPFGFLLRRLPSPLSQKLSVTIEHGHAPVAITVRDVNVTILRVNYNCGW